MERKILFDQGVFRISAKLLDPIKQAVDDPKRIRSNDVVIYDPKKVVAQLHSLGLRVVGRIVCFRDPKPQRSQTVLLDADRIMPQVSPAQHRVLLALCRPYKHRAPFAKPASNKEIADELVLSVEAVKSHLRALFSKFELEEFAGRRRSSDTFADNLGQMGGGGSPAKPIAPPGVGDHQVQSVPADTTLSAGRSHPFRRANPALHLEGD